MTKELSHYQLAEIVQGMDNIMHKQPALALLLGAKIDHFYKTNSLRINNIEKRVAEIVNTYVKKDESGKLMTTKNDKGEEVYVFDRDLERQKYERDLEQFMNIRFKVTL